jgi:hypothetical protein
MHCRKDLLDGGSAHRRASAYTQNNKNSEQKQADTHGTCAIRILYPKLERTKTIFIVDRGQ